MDDATRARIEAITKPSPDGIMRKIVTPAMRQAGIQELIAAVTPAQTISQSVFGLDLMPGGQVVVRICPYIGDIEEALATDGDVFPFPKTIWAMPVDQLRQLHAAAGSLIDAVDQAVAAEQAGEPDQGRDEPEFHADGEITGPGAWAAGLEREAAEPAGDPA